ncbi:MAG TPA: FAD-dependent oxidoreductase [Caulobacteraceae bacterium]
MSNKNRDKALGMDRPIDRRDFLNGVAVTVGALGTGAAGGVLAQAGASPWPQDQAGYYPPTLNGMRGSHPGSFENAHRLRDGDFWTGQNAPKDTGEIYDLVIVGGGISGLSAAWFYRAARPGARILILDNHDDFGGHAKRNEFHLDGKLHLLNGGTLEIDSPFPYSPAADGLLKALGIDPPALEKACDRDEIYGGLGLQHGVFFDRETFGADATVAGMPSRYYGPGGSWPQFLAKAPLDAATRADILRIETGETDYLPGLSDAQKKDRLSRISYRAWLRDYVKAGPAALAFYQNTTNGEWGCGIDAVSALDCWGFHMSGFKGLKLVEGPAPRMSYTPRGYVTGGSYTFHFPDGNASIARLLVRGLVPGVLAGHDCRDVVTSIADYPALDRPDNQVRIRLSSICVRARNLGEAGKPEGVAIAYARGDGVYQVKARACVLACWNMMIPYLCPEMAETQKSALHKLVKTPLVYTSVALRDWRAFHKLGVASLYAPGGYHTELNLNWPVDIGGCTAERSPDKPILLHMTRTPCHPGLPEFDQNRAGRAELLITPFSTFERQIRDQLGRALGPGGFDPATDITAITVNRWPHGYAPEWNALWDEPAPEDQLPNVIGRKPFGRIFIANSDAGAAAYTSSAIDQARRAVDELLAI